MTDDDTGALTPKGAMDALTRVAIKAEALQSDLELVRLAFVGALHEVIEDNLPPDSLPVHFKCMLDKLMHMYSDAHDVATLVRDAGVALYPLVEEQTP